MRRVTDPAMGLQLVLLHLASSPITHWRNTDKRSMKLLLLSLITVVACTAHAAAQIRVPENDTQSWNDFQLTVPMSKKVDLVTLLTLRFGNNLTKPVDERAG